MNKQLISENLLKLGLENDEAIIYLHLLEKGAKTPLELARETNINRSKIYRLTEKMQKKHILEETNTAWGQKLQASDPSHLEILVKEAEEELKSKEAILPSLIEGLMQMTNSTQSIFEVKHYKGIEGFKQIIWNEFKSKELLVFGFESMNEMVGKQFAEKLRQEGVARKQKIYEITNTISDTYTDNKIFVEKHFQRKKISEQILKVRHYISIYNDTITICNWDQDNLIGMEIINQPLADMFKQMFWHYWEL